MAIVNTLEKIVIELSPKDASKLKFWLNEYKASRRYKHIKAYTAAVKLLAEFQKRNGCPLWN